MGTQMAKIAQSEELPSEKASTDQQCHQKNSVTKSKSTLLSPTISSSRKANTLKIGESKPPLSKKSQEQQNSENREKTSAELGSVAVPERTGIALSLEETKKPQTSEPEKPTPVLRSSLLKTSVPQTETSKTSKKSSAAPQTSTSRSAAPETSTSRFAAPQTSKSRSAAPETSKSRSAAPETSKSRSAAPETSTSHSAAAETSKSRSAAPETSTSHSEAPQTSTSRSAAPQTSTSRSAAPQTSTSRSEAPQTSTSNQDSPENKKPQTSDTQPKPPVNGNKSSSSSTKTSSKTCDQPKYYLQWDGFSRTRENIGVTCFLCEEDLSYTQADYDEAAYYDDPESDPLNYSEVAVLPCGHCFHFTCFLNTMPPEEQCSDPPCIICASFYDD